jgi:hypothetical protein
MKAILPITALALLAGGASAQPASDTRPPAGAPSRPATMILPTLQRDEAPGRTPAEWEALRERRRAELAQQKIERVAPLPAQQLTPPPPPAPASSPAPH